MARFPADQLFFNCGILRIPTRLVTTYCYTVVLGSFPIFLFPPQAMLEFPAFHVNPLANMEIKNNTSINAVLLTHWRSLRDRVLAPVAVV